jgi:hypothetical protein
MMTINPTKAAAKSSAISLVRKVPNGAGSRAAGASCEGEKGILQQTLFHRACPVVAAIPARSASSLPSSAKTKSAVILSERGEKFL